MATGAARKAVRVADNAAAIIGAELLAAAQGIDLRRPLKTTAALERVHARVRKIAAKLDADRYMADELTGAQDAVLAGAIADAAPVWTE
jgi:histidine ammonia-lyase